MTERISPRQFHEADGVEDWRVVADGACAHFRTGSFATGARLVRAISELAGVEEHHPDVDLRLGGVTVRLVTITPDHFGLNEHDVELARQISTVARKLGVLADPSAVQTILIAIDAMDIPSVMPLWRAVLGYRDRADSPEDLVDPHRRGPSFWFQQMDAPRPLRNRIHIDLATPYDMADERRAAALAGGGHVVDDERPWVIADAEGNEVCAGGANPDLVPREPGQREGWDLRTTEGATGLVEVGWRQFHETDGVEDWRMLDMGAITQYRTESFARGVELVGAICQLDGLENRRPDIDVRSDAVTVRLVTLTSGFGGPASQHDVVLARQISAIACEFGMPADPIAAQTLLVAIDAMDIPSVMPFWSAVLGYEKRQDTDEDLLDPNGRWVPFWFQQMDAPRPQRNRMHIDVWVPHDQADARIAAAIAAGGHLVTDQYAPAWWVLADAEGNECCVATWMGRD